MDSSFKYQNATAASEVLEAAKIPPLIHPRVKNFHVANDIVRANVVVPLQHPIP